MPGRFALAKTTLILALMTGVIMNCSTRVSQPFTERLDSISRLVDAGEYSQARNRLMQELQDDSGLAPAERRRMEIELERMDRIEKDFRASKAEVLEFIRQYKEDAGDVDLEKWIDSRALEMKIIDGEERYFNRAARNLFRIDRDMKAVWREAHNSTTAGSGETSALDRFNMEIMSAAAESGRRYVKPVRLRITQGVQVDADAVPAGEIIRCWIPFPREIEGRQVDIKLLATNPEDHVLAPADALQRTVYFKRTAIPGKKTRFEVSYEYTSHGSYTAVDPEMVRDPADAAALEQYLREEPPHIMFTERLRGLSDQIVGEETNPYRKAQKLFAWIDGNIPWASAREYSTLRNIPEYCINNGHGDCGIQALTFITLCRLNGIPARWQSGWEFEPPDDSMHDWGMIYFEPYGWMPMDVTYGLRRTEDEQFKWFYLTGMDSYRLIFNDAYSQPFTPAKTHHRSETVDSQRGEVEWPGGNLYFDQWDWSFDWEILEN